MNLPTSALRRGAILTSILTLAAVLAACSGGGSADPSDDNSAGGTIAVIDGAVAISSDDLAFDANVIMATAGEAFTVTLTNNEANPHNFSVYVEEGGEAIVLGGIIGEGETDEVEVPALEPGEYFFVCDLHRDEMSGTIVVEG
ncbi:MAG: cupredoxin domain-containing protein [Chloroflexi bacterium]|nr:cupredoxin domain-containing protein [Chloroflexota bacterium]